MADYYFNETVKIPFETVKKWSAEAYQAFGMSEADALVTADVQATADLRGVYSHGIQRCEAYINRIQHGVIDPKARPVILKDANALVQVDGKNSMGQVSGVYAMKLAIERAKKFGTSTVTLKGGNHNGTMAYFAMMAAAEGMIGYCMTQGSGNCMAPSGGREAILGNNPISYAIPAEKHPAVVVDMALSAVAKGKLDMAAITGGTIPNTWALDREGRQITDPTRFYTLQPIAGYKGYGLSFVMSLMTAVLNDTPWGRSQRDLLDPNPSDCLDIAQTMQVVNVGAITDVDAFKRRVDEAIDMVKNSTRGEGVSEILVPGEPEARTEARQLAEGISYPVELIEKVARRSKEWGIFNII